MPGWWRSRSRQNSPPRLNARSRRRGVVEHRLPFMQVGDEDVADRAAGDAVPVDQLGRAELTRVPNARIVDGASGANTPIACSSW